MCGVGVGVNAAGNRPRMTGLGGRFNFSYTHRQLRDPLYESSGDRASQAKATGYFALIDTQFRSDTME